MSDQGKTQGLESFLNPSILRTNLIMVALYIAAFELLKDSVVDRLKRFYDPHFKLPSGQDYESEVKRGRRKGARGVLPTSLMWLRRKDVIDKADMKNFKKAAKLRNTLTHEMGRILWDGIPSELPARFLDMVSLLDKIELWWTVNVDVMKPEEINVATIMPGKSFGLRLLMQVATLSEEESRKYLDEAIRLTRPPRVH